MKSTRSRSSRRKGRPSKQSQARKARKGRKKTVARSKRPASRTTYHKATNEITVSYTNKHGTRVTYRTKDRGKRGLGPKLIPRMKRGGLGGAGYTTADTTARHKRLRASVKADGYRATLGRLNALSVLGKTDFSKAKLDRIARDRRWLSKQFGGPGSFGPRKGKGKGKRKGNPGRRARATPPRGEGGRFTSYPPNGEIGRAHV